MIYIEPNESFTEKYLNTMSDVGKTIFSYIYSKFDHVFLEIFEKPNEITILKGADKEALNSIDKVTHDFRSVCLQMRNDLNSLKTDEDISKLYNTYFKSIDKMAENYNVFHIVDCVLHPKNISYWKLEDEIITYLNQIQEFEVVEISKDTKQKSFWKHLKPDIGVIIDGFIYPVNSLLYFDEFIGNAKPETRISKYDAIYKPFELGGRHIEIEYGKKFTIAGNTEIRIKLV